MTIALSIIIPTLNEAQVLGRTLAQLRHNPPHKRNCEVIIVDGGSTDATVSIAKKTDCKIISNARGRSRQMNAGAAQAVGEILLFLHADTLLPDNFPELIHNAISSPAVAAGAFSLAIDSPSKGLAAIAYMANLRSRLLHLPYGDQAYFVTREMFIATGGFPEIEIMEDFVFIRKIKTRGKIIILPEYAITSARRWRNIGIVRTTLINQLIVCGYWLGVSPVKLAGWYRRMRKVGNNNINR